MSACLIADFFNIMISAGVKVYLIGLKESNIVMSAITFMTIAAYMVFVVFVARPVTIWIIKRTPDGSLLDEASLVAVIFITLLCGLLSEVCKLIH